LAEVRPTLRGLWRRRLQTGLVVLTLTAGIAATATMYTVAEGVLFSPLPYPHADRLVSIGMVSPNRVWRDDAPGLQSLQGVAVATLADWRERVPTLERIEAVELLSQLLPDRGAGPELVSSAAVTSGWLDVFDADVVMGRTFVPADFVFGAPRVMLLSHSSWVSRYGSDPDVIGRVETGLTIVGVLSAEFQPPAALVVRPVEFWLPLSPENPRYDNRGRRTASVVGVLRPGTDLPEVRAELAAAQVALAGMYPDAYMFPEGTHHSAGANDLHAETVGGAAAPVTVYFGAAVLLLLIAGVNSANLFLLRGLERESETMVRLALGADRRRVIGGVLLESVMLSTAGGVLGGLLAWVGVTVFLQLGITSIPRLSAVTLSPWVLVVAMGVSLVTGLLAALVPAWRTVRRAGVVGMRTASATVTTGGTRLRSALVAVQLAIAVVLGVGATLLIASFLNFSRADLGFNPEGLTAVTVPLKMPGPQRPSGELWNLALEEAGRVAGVQVVAAASDAPFRNHSWAPWLSLPTDPADHRRTGIAAFVVTPTYFNAIGAALRAGRAFSPTDSSDSEPVAIVNEAFIAEHLADRGPLGARLVMRTENEGAINGTMTMRIVGIAPNIVQGRVEEPIRPSVYLPHTQHARDFSLSLLIRSTREGEAFNRELRQAVARFNPVVPVTSLYPATRDVARTMAEPTFRAVLFGSFAGVALLLAVIGVFGALSHDIGRRTRELGLRMALGADRGTIVRLVLRQGGLITVTGLALGFVAAALAARALGAFLFGIEPLNVTAFGVAIGAVALVAACATWAPARQASRVDLVSSLRD
jgi:predicted permease